MTKESNDLKKKTNAGILTSQFSEHFLSNSKHHIAMENSADDIENKLKF